MTVFSKEARNAMAKATPMSAERSFQLKLGKAGERASSSKALKVSRDSKPGTHMRSIQPARAETVRLMAKLGSAGIFF